MYTERLSEQLALVACIDPDEYGTGAVSSDVIDMAYHRRVLFIIAVGDMASGSTADFKVQQSTASAGTYVDIAGKAVTQLTQAGSDNDKQVIVEVAADELTAGYRYIKGVLTVGTDAVDATVIALADCSRYSVASGYDLSSVDEIVA